MTAAQELGTINSRSIINPQQNILWEWNQSDVTQWGDGVGGPNASVGTPTGTLTKETIGGKAVGVIDADPATPILWYAHTGGSGTPAPTAIYTINDLPTLPNRYEIQCRIGPRDNGGMGLNCLPRLQLVYQGATTRQIHIIPNSGGLTAQMLSANGAGENAQNVGASINMSAVPLTNSDDGNLLRVICDLSEPSSGVDPGMKFWVDTIDGGMVVRASITSWTTVGGGTPPSSGWDSSWQTGGSLKQMGIAFTELNATAGNGYLSDFRILTFTGG